MTELRATKNMAYLSLADTAEMIRLAETARAAADGDSNDTEIEALQDALEHALLMLGIEEVPDSYTVGPMEKREGQMDKTVDDPVTAAHYVLSVAGDGRAIRPGGFTSLLVQAMFHADPSNRARLAQGFSVLMSAVIAYKDDPDGRERLQKLAGLS
jgi:hypothetical protein